MTRVLYHLYIFQSTLLMRGATIVCNRGCIVCHYFNPRSSCEERPNSGIWMRTWMNFNPRSSCEERRCRPSGPHPSRDFNPRSSCEERHLHGNRCCSGNTISIHAPHARSDVGMFFSVPLLMRFQSTLLMRGATYKLTIGRGYQNISIHAPHARSDISASFAQR